jgi:hypothetical protein
MIDIGVSGIVRSMILGIVGLLLTLSFNFVQNGLEETGERYYKMPVLDNEFKGKRVRQAALILIPLAGFILMSVVQPRLVQIAMQDFRVLSSLLGLLIAVILISSNANPESWKVNDGRPLTQYAGIVSISLTFGPWVGPFLLNLLVGLLTQQWNRLTSFLTAQWNAFLSFVTSWVSAHSMEISIVIILLVLAGYFVATKNER